MIVRNNQDDKCNETPFLNRKQGPQSTNNDKNTGYLIARQNRIFAHNFNNNKECSTIGISKESATIISDLKFFI